MRKWLFVPALAMLGLLASGNRAAAWWNYYPAPASVAFPMLTPSGYFTNTYYYAWYYPWYANYNYSHGSYSHWWRSHGWAFYPGQQIPPNFRIDPIRGAYFIEPMKPDDPKKLGEPKKVEPKKEPKKKDKKDAKKEPGKVTIHLPADAKLTFNGVAATGTGEERSFLTPELDEDRDYEYVLAAEVTRDGQTVVATERVIVRAGNVTTVSLRPTATAAR